MFSSFRVLTNTLPSLRSRRFAQIQFAFQSLSNLPDSTPNLERPLESSTNLASIPTLLLSYGFPKSQLHKFLKKNQNLTNSASLDIKKCFQLLLSLNLPQSAVLSIISTCPWVLELEFLRKWYDTFLELGFHDASPIFVHKVLEQAGNFQLETSVFRKSVQVMKNLGFGVDIISNILVELPLVSLTKKTGDFEGRIRFFMAASGIKSNDEIYRICNLFPGFFKLHLDFQLKPLFQEIQDLGFSREEVKNVLLEEPRVFLTMEVGELSRYMDLLNSLKCRMPIKERILSKGHAMACLDVKARIEFICKRGLIRRDAFKILFIEPRIIIYSVEDIEKKMDFLVHKLGFPVEYLIDCPEYLGVNLEKHIIPRYEVIEYLKSQDGLGFNVGMKHLVKVSKLRFYNMFVKPYPECEKIFNRLNEEAKSQSPTGLWKLFKPQKFSGTAEDVKNMKWFMQSIR